MKYDIYSITTYDKMEPLGTKEKFWFYTEKDNISRLCKIGRKNTGENWAEKVTSEIAKLLSIPCATYDFALWEKRQCVVSPSFVPEYGRLIHGNELLVSLIDEKYPINRKYKVTEYKLSTIIKILQDLSEIVKLPIGYDTNSAIKKPIDIFISYIMFDCLISNPDRQHENWGIIFDDKEKEYYLAPTYDHASGLGCRVSDEERKNRLSTKDERYSIKAFVQKPKTPFYDNNGKNLKTIDAFKLLAIENKVASEYWLNKVKLLPKESIKKVFDKIPNNILSSAAVDFAISLLNENIIRLLAIREH